MSITRIFDILERYQTHFPNVEDALAGKEEGEWRKYSTSEYVENSKLVSYGLLAMGIKKGEKIVTISNSRPEWNFADMGMMQTGAIHVPVYPTISTDDYRYILNHSDARFIIVSDRGLYRKIKNILEDLPNVEAVFSFDKIDGVRHFSEILDLGRKNTDTYKEELKKLKAGIKKEDLATIIYTSGTTGKPKGVMLSHHNIVSNVVNAVPRLTLKTGDKVISFLPLCHIYERTLLYIQQYSGVSIYYAQNLGTIANDINEVKPQGFDTVPRLLEKVYDSIMAKASKLPPVKRKLFDWAMNVGDNFDVDKKGSVYKAKLKIARKLVFSKWVEALGGNVNFIGVGGSALQPRLERLFRAAGMDVHQGYGLTETSPLIAANGRVKPLVKLGTVGPVIDGVEVRIADDGEILCKGPNVMMGYYKSPEQTREVIDEDGWFHTGDIGELVEGKYLKITDRKKEIFKLSSGKYIAPQHIENKLKFSPYIEQAMVIGEYEKFASALIYPNMIALKEFANKNNINFLDDKDLTEKPEIIKLIKQEVTKVNKTLGSTEQVKKERLVYQEWTVEGGELSPTQKLKRRVIKEKHKELIQEIYE
jgi:long-chain acyl-CoA synthetase